MQPRKTRSQLKTELRSSNYQLVRTTAHLAKSDEKKKKAEERLKARGIEISTLQAQRKAKNQEIATLQNQLAAKTREAATLQNQLSLTQTQVLATRSRLGASEHQMLQMDADFQNQSQELQTTKSKLQSTKSNLATTKSKLEATKTLKAEYNNFANMTRPVIALAGGAACAYAAYNNPTMISEGVNLLLRHIGSELIFKNSAYSTGIAAVASYFIGSKVSSLVGPTALYATMKIANHVADAYSQLINGTFIGMPKKLISLGFSLFKSILALTLIEIPFLLIRTIDLLDGLAFNTLHYSMKTIKYICLKICEHRTAILSLVVAGLLAHYNPTVNGIIISYFQRQIANSISI